MIAITLVQSPATLNQLLRIYVEGAKRRLA
jgi:hypothetical protein